MFTADKKWLERWFPILASVIGAAFVAVFLSLITWTLTRGTHCSFCSDMAGQLRAAVKFLANPGVGALRNQDRPIFGWPVLLLLWGLNVPASYNEVSLLSSLFHFCLLFAAVHSIVRFARAGGPFSLWVSAMLCALPSVCWLSSRFLPDIPALVAYLWLLDCSLRWNTREPPSAGRACATAGVVAWGLTTQISFLGWAVLVLSFTWGQAAIERRLTQRTYLKRLGLFALVLACLLPFAWPNHLPEQARGWYNFHFVMDVLDRSSAGGFWVGALWFPRELLNELTIAHWITLVALVGVGATAAVRNWPEFKKSARPFLAAAAGLAASVVLVGLLLRTRDLRTFLPLYATFFLLVSLAAAQSFRLEPKLRSCVLSALTAGVFFSILSVICGSGLFPGLQPLAGALTRFDPNSDRLQVYLPKIPSENVESSGLLRVMEALRNDCARSGDGCGPGDPRNIYFVHDSELLNPSAIRNFSMTYWAYLPSAGSSPNIQPEFTASDTPYRVGGAWGEGGIPRDFFNSRYVVYWIDASSGAATFNPSAALIAKKLSANDPEFRTGLTSVALVATARGRVEILRRDRLPKTGAFVEITRELSRVDSDNLWNYPFVRAAAALSKDQELSSLEARLRREVERKGLPPYMRNISGEPWLGALVRGDSRALEAISYPAFLARRE